MKDLKFHFKKGGGGCKILKLNPKQIAKYREEAQLDYIGILLKQMGENVRLDWDLGLKYQEVVNRFNANEKSPRNIYELHTHRALIDYLSQSVNISAVTEFETMLVLLQNHYDLQDLMRGSVKTVGLSLERRKDFQGSFS